MTTSFTARLAALGEELEIDGNGAVRVKTHAGLWITITIRSHAPSLAAQAFLRRIVQSCSTSKASWASTVGNRNLERMLERRKLIERTKRPLVGYLLRPTKAGRIAAKRFEAMEKERRRRAKNVLGRSLPPMVSP